MDIGIKTDLAATMVDVGTRRMGKGESAEKTAEQFESFLIFSILKEFDKAMNVTKKGYAEQMQMSLFYEKVGDALAKKGIGIKDMITKYTRGETKVSGDNGENR